VNKNISIPFLELRVEEIQLFNQNKAQRTRGVEIILDSFNKITKAIHHNLNILKFEWLLAAWAIPSKEQLKNDETLFEEE